MNQHLFPIPLDRIILTQEPGKLRFCLKLYLFTIWSGRRESNSYIMHGKHVDYHCPTPASIWQGLNDLHASLWFWRPRHNCLYQIPNWSGCSDSNWGSPVPKTGAITKLRYIPINGAFRRNRTINLSLTRRLLYLIELWRHLVELKRFELSTFTMLMWHSPSWVTAPRFGGFFFQLQH